MSALLPGGVSRKIVGDPRPGIHPSDDRSRRSGSFLRALRADGPARARPWPLPPIGSAYHRCGGVPRRDPGPVGRRRARGARLDRARVRSLGAEVVLVRTNDEALEALAAGPFDVVVSDIHRPGEEPGSELGLRMWASGFRAPVVHFVASEEPDQPPPVGSVGVTSDEARLLELIHRASPARVRAALSAERLGALMPTHPRTIPGRDRPPLGQPEGLTGRRSSSLPSALAVRTDQGGRGRGAGTGACPPRARPRACPSAAVTALDPRNVRLPPQSRHVIVRGVG